MSLLLTVYNSPAWKILVDVSGLTVINETAPTPFKNAAILQPSQSLTTVSVLLSSLASEQKLWLAVVQAEYFLADTLEHGGTLEGAAQAWELQTTDLLGLQRQQRKKLQLFNMHQALAQPAQFRLLLDSDITITEYAPQATNSSLSLLAACQYLTQNPQLQTLNTRLQASVLPLCDSEKLMLNIDQILCQNHNRVAAADGREIVQAQLQQVQEQLEASRAASAAQLASVCKVRDFTLAQLQQTKEQSEASFTTNAKQLAAACRERDKAQQEVKNVTAEFQAERQMREKLETTLKVTSEERDLILAQLQQVQEQAEQYYLTLQAEQQNNKHTLLARDKQQAKEMTKLEAELRKTKASASNAEYAGLMLQQELDKLRTSVSWKAAKPIRLLGRLVRKKDPARDKLMQDVGLLLTSEYFDVNWYLRTYTDVVEKKINPAEHYLNHGAAEGRLPGPLFDGNWYRQHYPDVAEANINPLLHFILYGQQEGRESSPLLLTNTNQDAEE